MDSVRFGRALGLGARHAVKTLVTAVDAATAEGPSGKTTRASQGSVRPAGASDRAGGNSRPIAQATGKVVGHAARSVTQKASSTTTQARELKRGVARGGRRFGETVWGPFVRLTGVLWLEVTGVFFGIFALFAIGTVWKLRTAWHATATNGAEHKQLLGATAMAIVFGYFCVSGFAKARRREKRR